MADDEYLEIAEDYLEEEFPENDVQATISEEMEGIVLTGSAVNGDLHEPEDLDLFAYVPLESELEHDLPPVQISSYEGNDVEISLMTLERLERAARRKDDLPTYAESEVVKSESEEFEQLVKEAGSLTDEEKRSYLWTDYCQFQIDGEGLEAERDDFSREVIQNKQRELYARSRLFAEDKFVREKWYGEMLQKVDPEAYRIAKSGDLEEVEQAFTELLIDNGFDQEEIDRWYENNSELLRFQRH